MAGIENKYGFHMVEARGVLGNCDLWLANNHRCGQLIPGNGAELVGVRAYGQAPILSAPCSQ